MGADVGPDSPALDDAGDPYGGGDHMGLQEPDDFASHFPSDMARAATQSPIPMPPPQREAGQSADGLASPP